MHNTVVLRLTRVVFVAASQSEKAAIGIVLRIMGQFRWEGASGG